MVTDNVGFRTLTTALVVPAHWLLSEADMVTVCVPGPKLVGPRFAPEPDAGVPVWTCQLKFCNPPPRGEPLLEPLQEMFVVNGGTQPLKPFEELIWRFGGDETFIVPFPVTTVVQPVIASITTSIGTKLPCVV